MNFSEYMELVWKYIYCFAFQPDCDDVKKFVGKSADHRWQPTKTMTKENDNKKQRGMWQTDIRSWTN